MSTKNTIITNLVEHLKLINGTTHTIIGCPFSPYTYKTNIFGNVTEEVKFLDTINDFPTVTFFRTSAEQRSELGGGEVYGTVTYVVRCYFMDAENDEQADDFIEDLQFSINSFAYTQNNNDLVDLRILGVSSDEQILYPYGIAEVSFVLTYRLTI
jgi:hypothetical protein